MGQSLSSETGSRYGRSCSDLMGGGDACELDSAPSHKRGVHRRTRNLCCASSNKELQVTILGQGGAPLGDLYREITDSSAIETLHVAHSELGVNFFDTSPWYGVGLSEARFGIALHRFPRDSFVLSTKVGRYLIPNAAKGGKDHGFAGGMRFDIKFDYSAAAVERQHQDSLQRLGLGRADSLVIHDLEPRELGGWDVAKKHLDVLRSSGFPRLQKLRRDGAIAAFGAGVNAAEAGEDVQKKDEWNKFYVGELLKMHKPVDRLGGLASIEEQRLRERGARRRARRR